MSFYFDDFSAIQAETCGDPRISVAILDGPVDRDHPALMNADLTDLSCGSRGRSSFVAAADHGTHVCSIIFGQNHDGIRGIAPLCRGILISIFRDGDTPGSIIPCSQIELAAAIERAVVAGANIINISGGQYSTYGTAHPILTRAVRGAAKRGILIVSATGNDACACHHIPSADPSVLAVGAHDDHGIPLASSNWGEKYRQNGIVALGENVIGAVPGGTRACTGSSFATPIVSGVAALMMSCLLKNHRQPDGRVVQQAILQSAFRCFDPHEACQRMLAGRLNPIGAFNLLHKDLHTMTHQKNQPAENVLPATNPPLPEHDQPVQTMEVQAVQPATSAPPVTGATSVAADIANVLRPQSASLAPSGITDSAVAPSDCGCGCATGGALVYALGEIGYDFGTEARRDSIQQHFDDTMQGKLKPGAFYNPKQISKYLAEAPWAAADFIWTLSVNNVPIYAIRPSGPYAAETYALLAKFFNEQLEPVKVAVTDGSGNISKEAFLSQRAAIPGRVVGRVTLLNGHSIPEIQPEIRGMANWNIEALVASVAPVSKTMTVKQKAQTNEQRKSVVAVLNKMYSVYQNMGITPEDRSINYVATNIVQLTEIIQDSIGKNRFFDKIEVEPSEICRPHSECWVVKVFFFRPETRNLSERKKFRITVDVSDVVPVVVGEVQGWHVR